MPLLLPICRPPCLTARTPATSARTARASGLRAQKVRTRRGGGSFALAWRSAVSRCLPVGLVLISMLRERSRSVASRVARRLLLLPQCMLLPHTYIHDTAAEESPERRDRLFYRSVHVIDWIHCHSTQVSKHTKLKSRTRPLPRPWSLPTTLCPRSVTALPCASSNSSNYRQPRCR